MATSHRSQGKPKQGRRSAGQGSDDPVSVMVRDGHLRPATRRLNDVLAKRGPLTGPITDAGTRSLLTVRGEAPAGAHGES